MIRIMSVVDVQVADARENNENVMCRAWVYWLWCSSILCSERMESVGDVSGNFETNYSSASDAFCARGAVG